MKTTTKVFLSTLIGAILSVFFVLYFSHLQGYFGFWDYFVVIIVSVTFAVFITLGIDLVVCVHKDEKKRKAKTYKTWSE